LSIVVQVLSSCCLLLLAEPLKKITLCQSFSFCLQASKQENIPTKSETIAEVYLQIESNK